jgi:hypothetical protein
VSPGLALTGGRRVPGGLRVPPGLRGGPARRAGRRLRRLRPRLWAAGGAAAGAGAGAGSSLGERAAAVGGVACAALVDARGLVESALLDTMRSQCHGLALAHGGGAGAQTGGTAQAVFHACMVLPDTMEGCLTAFVVLTSEYPAGQCICRLGQGEARRQLERGSGLGRLCLGHENAAAQHAWTQDLEFRTDPARAVTVCFAAMDGANARLRDAFDKALRRVYMLAQNAGAAADAVLATLTGDTVACDAFDVSPYVLSIVPEPIDYFMHCIDTVDCRTRWLEEFRAFEAANRSVALGPVRPGVSEEVVLPVESLLFEVQDLAEGRAATPFVTTRPYDA